MGAVKLYNLKLSKKSGIIINYLLHKTAGTDIDHFDQLTVEKFDDHIDEFQPMLL